MSVTPVATRIRLGLVDDHALLLRALAQALGQDEDKHVVLVHDGADGVLSAVLAAKLDVLLLDRRLGDRDGLDVLEQILAVRPGLAVVMLTAVDDLRTLAAALERGARGLISKGAPLEDVRAAVVEASLGRSVLPHQRRALRLTPLVDLPTQPDRYAAG